jgi:group II intron reverse transcriptase/maturase
MTKAQNFIEIAHKLGQKQYELKKVYRRIQDRDLFLVAYGNIYANKGATTVGVDPQDTVDGMSLDRIEKIIEKLKNGIYQWQPARRVNIPKGKGKTRPIDVLVWSDKLLLEVIRMVLEAYYEPQFSEHSHGFRPDKGCHTALREIYVNWKGTKWFIEADIRGCFNNIDFNILLGIISRNIKDNRLSKLLKEMLKAGYTERWKYYTTYSGTPQGSGLSPLLANVYLNELDNFITNELIPQYTKGTKRRVNPEYTRLTKKLSRAKKEGNINLYKRLKKERQQIPYGDPQDPNYSRLKYCRYADDFALGWTGTRQEAEEIKKKIQIFLQTLNLELSAGKTLITHATSQKARFLGYDISVIQDNNKLTKNKKTAQLISRTRNGKISLSVPQEIAKTWTNKLTRKGKPIHRAELINCSDYEIILTYGLEFQGLCNYYAMAHNVSTVLYRIKYISEQSLAKTLAAKHKKSVKWVYRRFCRQSEEDIKAFILEIPNPNKPEKPLKAQFGNRPIKYNPYASITEEKAKLYKGRNELVRRLLANECELCGSTDKIAVHHVQALKNVRKKYRGRTEPPTWAKLMMERNRKTVVVCHQCHTNIHAGRYDGKKVG